MKIVNKVGKIAKKGASKTGSAIKKGAVHLYENKDVYIEKIQDKVEQKRIEAEKRKERFDEEVARYERQLKGKSSEELKEIAMNERKSNAERRAAKNLM